MVRNNNKKLLLPVLLTILTLSCAPLMTKEKKSRQELNLFDKKIETLRLKFDKVRKGMTKEEIVKLGFVVEQNGHRINNTKIVEMTSTLSYLNAIVTGRPPPNAAGKDEEVRHYIAWIFITSESKSKKGRIFFSNQKDNDYQNFFLGAITFNEDWVVVDRTMVDDPSRIEEIQKAWASGVTGPLGQGAKKGLSKIPGF